MRRAFTLFQLLILLAFLLLLLALLLPAVAKTRLAAARAQSMNNLKQIGIGIHNYYTTHNQLSSGVDANHFSTISHLLPYLEQDAAFRQIDFKKSIDDKANAPSRMLTLPMLLNPSDPIKQVSMDYGATNYLFCAGSKYDLKDNDGLFYRDSKLKFNEVTDGLSNTIATVETLKGDSMMRAINPQRQHVGLKKESLKNLNDESGVQDFKDDKNIAADRCASWMDGRFLQGTFTATRVVNDARPDVDCGGQGGLSGPRTLTEATNVLLADGSVRTISMACNLNTWKILAGRNEGQVPGDF